MVRGFCLAWVLVAFGFTVISAADPAVPAEGPMLLVKDATLVLLFVLAALATREVTVAELRRLVGAALPRRSGARA